ncbi:uncharacterized protein LY89DRAFT_58922 [Mollisia scopiformis]|uniref:Uncharacterized protein n=1 Tax=Mollisia scopiformis TaxID=149040 RepID=A0A194XBX9_MOLSC|nr:uncharacterized protein LY89DRAFT_58922 [Mollisia scopiformis]KUJ17678.1 hypothetical protein LY89DRAFT_58922 [Mollisia scopiformis]
MSSYFGNFQPVQKYSQTILSQLNTFNIMTPSDPKPLSPTQIPISIDSQLTPTKAYYLLHHKHTTSVLSLTPHLPTLYTPTEGLSLIAASNLATSSGEPFPPVLYTLKKENLFGTHFTAKDDKGIEVAEWKSPILSLHMGTTQITFLHPDQHSDESTLTPIPSGMQIEATPTVEHHEVNGEMVQVRPVGVGRRAEDFVKDGMRYIWEVERHKHEHKNLHKVIHAESPTPSKILIASFAQPSPHSKDGLLVLDSRELDPLTGILTLCAMLESRIAEGDGDEQSVGERMSNVPVLMM